jgi:hypothetical protein
MGDQHMGNRFQAVLICATACMSAQSRHSFAVFFDNEQGVVSISGVVVEFRFTNPHGIIRIAARDKDGALQDWKAETNSPSILERRGWKRAVSRQET